MSRPMVVVVIAVLGGAAVLSGLLGITAGPAAFPGDAAANATVDSRYRFANAFWLAAGLLVWWSVRRPERRRRGAQLHVSVPARPA